MLNLLPWRQELLLKKKKQLIAMVLYGMLVTLIIMLTIRLILNNQLEYIKRENELLNTKIETQRNIKLSLTEKLKKTKMLTEIYRNMENQKKLLTILDEIAKSFPGNGYLISLSLAREGLWMEGVMLGTNQELIRTFTSSLNRKLSLNVSIKMLTSSVQKMMYKILILFPVIRPC